MNLEGLPAEIWYDIVGYLNGPAQLEFTLTCRSAQLENLKFKVNLNLIMSLAQDDTIRSTKSSNISSWSLNLNFNPGKVSRHDIDLAIMDNLKVSHSLVPYTAIDLTASETQYGTPENTQLLSQIKQLCESFHILEYTRRHPIGFNAAQFIPQCSEVVTLSAIHRSLQIGRLPNIKSLTLQTDGRFLTQDSQFDYKAIAGLANHRTLRHLILDGPWFECMIDYTEGVLIAIKTLKLESLVIDLDMLKDGPELIFSVIKEIPTLRRLGRLGRVDKRFWRLFPKFSCKHITNLELGATKVPNSHKMENNERFLKELAFGVLWAFPNLSTLSIYLGFQNSDEEQLYEIVKQLKEGLPVVYREYEESKLPDPSFRTLKRLEFLQCADVSLLQESRWKFLANNFAGGPRLEILVTDQDKCGTTGGKHTKLF